MGGYRKVNKDVKDDNVMVGIERVFMDFWGVSSLNVRYPGKEEYVVVEKGGYVAGNAYRAKNPRAEFRVTHDTYQESVEFDKDLAFEEKLKESNETELLLDEEFDLLMDDDEESGEARIFDISIPTRENADYEDYLDEESRELDEEFAKPTKLYPADAKLCCVYDEKLLVNVEGLNVPEFEKVCDYFGERRCDEGLPLVFIKNGKEYPANILIKTFDFDALSKAVGKNFFGLQL
jgi:hypothetical protein